MPLFACGINHKTAPIALREKIVFQEETLAGHMACVLARGLVSEVVILSTCNRTEIYCVAEDPEKVCAWILEQHEVDHDELCSSFYAYQDIEAVKHLMCVASGLDSMVLGEPQIFGQVKSAFAKAYHLKGVGPHLERLFPRAFSVAKHVRSHTQIGACPVSLASMTVKLAQTIFSDINTKKVLIIGTGETGALVFKHFYEDGVRKIYLASRSLERSEVLIERYQTGTALEITEIFNVIDEVDIVVSATASSLPILHKTVIERRVSPKRENKLLMIDVAVPRDIEPDVANIDYVDLYCVDDLQKTIQQNMTDRKHASGKAQEMIAKEAEDFMRWQDSLDAASIIKAYRDYIEGLRDEELAKALKALEQGEAAEKALKELARNLSNKFMHRPSVNLKKAGYEGRLDLLELTHKLFDIGNLK